MQRLQLPPGGSITHEQTGGKWVRREWACVHACVCVCVYVCLGPSHHTRPFSPMHTHTHTHTGEWLVLLESNEDAVIEVVGGPMEARSPGSHTMPTS